MQKISSYIYKNRIQIVSDAGYLPTEWRIVFQRTINIYQGIENTIEFDIKNGDQRRLDVSGLTMKMVILDELNQELCTVAVIPVPNTKGLASCTIPSSSLSSIKPQLLKYSLYVLNSNGTKSPIYGDVQYGMGGKLRLWDGVVPEELPPIIINTFTFLPDDTAFPTMTYNYFSEAVEINPPNDAITKPYINLEFIAENLDADVSIQITNYAVVSTATAWTTIETFSISPSTTIVLKQYNEIIDYSNNVGWMRVKYTPRNGNVGKIKQVSIKL